MRFIKVNAKLNVENRGGIITSFQLLLNVDLIGAFDKNTVLLKGGNTLLLNGREYKEFSVVDQNDIEKL